MKRTLYIILLLPLLVLTACQQEISPEQADRFIKFYGNEFMDEATDLEVLSDGSFALCGIDSIPGEGKRAVLIVTDEFGNPLEGFPKYYKDGNHPSVANSLVLKGGGENGFLLVGSSTVTELDTTSPANSRTHKDIFLVRTKKDGDLLWSKSFGSPEDESALHASTMYNSEGTILTGYQVVNGSRDIMIMGVTDTGDSIRLGIKPPGQPSEAASANYVVNAGDKYLVASTYKLAGRPDTDILLLCFDEDWSYIPRILDGGSDETGVSALLESPDRFLVLGNRTGLSGNSEILVYLVETTGIQITNSIILATISEAGSDLMGRRIRMTDEGRIAIVGTRETAGTKDIFVQFLGSNYSEQERVIFGAAGEQSGADLDVPEDGGLLLLGTNGDTQSSMISLIRTGDAGEL